MAEYIEREKVKELIKNFGKGAIEDGYKTLDPIDDIVLLASAVDLIPSVDVRAEMCKGCADKVKNAICQNTYPYFDKDGKAVNIWNAKTGYDAIDDVLKTGG